MGKKLLVLLLVLSSQIIYSQDTTVKKRYIDSLKYQLSKYTIMSYNHLNMYDRAESEKSAVKEKLSEADQYIIYLHHIDARKSRKYAVFFAGLSCLFMAITITFNNK